jgi:hypothetical protein
MEKFPEMVDMARTPEEVEKQYPGMPCTDSPVYPWGLQITLTECELDKLNVDTGDWGVGDMFHLHAFGRITSISESENENGNRRSVTIQIEAIAGEDEDEENERAESGMPRPYR